MEKDGLTHSFNLENCKKNEKEALMDFGEPLCNMGMATTTTP